MKRLTLIALLCLLATMSEQVWSLDCSSGDILLGNQEAVDNFQATYGNGGVCDRVTGDLIVFSMLGGTITNIDGLADLTSIVGHLGIRDNDFLTDVDGLINLASVGRGLQFSDNAVLTDIDGLTNLTSVVTLGFRNNAVLADVDGLINLTGSVEYLTIDNNDSLINLNGLIKLSSVVNLRIKGNAALSDINGLINLTNIGGSLSIDENSALININGLNNLTGVSGDLSIIKNSALTTIDGLVNLTGVVQNLSLIDNDLLLNINSLTNLTSVKRDLIIDRNLALIDVDGLANLISVGGFLGVGNNDSLINLNGLSSLTTVGTNLEIEFNANLTNLNGLSNLSSVGGNLWLASNASLANIDGLSNLINLGGSVWISNNDPLTNINGLVGLTSVGGTISISKNDSLLDFDGLTNLNTVEEGLRISGNTALTNIDGLANLTIVGGALSLAENSVLGRCSGLAILLGWPSGPPSDNVGNNISVYGNDVGCNSIQEILDSISGPTAPNIISTDVQNSQATLTFSLSTTTDTLWPITGYHAQCLANEHSVFQNNTATDIPDESSVVSSLTVFGVAANNIAAPNITVNITHPRTRHLTLTLMSPSGTSVKLWDEAVGDGENLVGTFPTPLEPAESLDAFNGEVFNGEWQLTVADGVALQTGTLNSWGITVRDKVTARSETSPALLTGLANNRLYSCTVSAVTDLGIGPVSNAASVIYTVDTFNVSGNVNGLMGTGLILQNNAVEKLAIGADGNFTFAIALDDGSAYEVTVLIQPTDPSQTCNVSNGSGTLSGADITGVSVTCVTDTFTVGGNVTGLAGNGLVLQNNAGDNLSIGADGSFTFATALDDLSAYAVTVLTQPTSPSQTCSVTSGSGSLAGANVTDVSVTCTTDTFTVGGNVSGLAGTGLVLQNNTGDNLAIGADGSFTFATALDDLSAYAVTVLTQPTSPSQTCSVSNGSGTLAGSNITDVAVICVTPTDHFVTTWKTDNPGTSTATSITVPMVGGPYDVDWNNDGAFDELGLSGSVTHDYGVAGTYTIRIQGTYDSIWFYVYGYSGDVEKILSLDQWGTNSWTSMERSFRGAVNLTVPATDTPDFSAVTSMGEMFNGATSANPDTSSWDTSAVTSMGGMFNGATSANPDTSSWDTSAVTTMWVMFFDASTANPDTSGWNTSSVTDMANMFQGATSFDQDIGSWDVTALKDATNMFTGVTLSTANYESLLIGWSDQALQPGVTFSGGNSSYCSASAYEARSSMIASEYWVITDGGQACPNCNVNTVSGVTEYFDATHEACEILVLGPDFMAADGASVSVSSGWEIDFLPGFIVEQGATLKANVCGQSLCMISTFPMPYGCHSCVDQICDIDPTCCALEFDQACLDKVDTVCGLACE